MHIRYVEPTKAHAHIVLPENEPNETADGLLLTFVRQRVDEVMRTCAAHPSLAAEFSALGPLAAVSWPWVSAWGSLEPSRRGGENAPKTGKNGVKMGEITA